MQNSRSTVIVFKSDGLGQTQAHELKEKLGISFLTLIADVEPLPRAICFYTDGVKLACEGSPVLESLQALESQGVRLILCTTCLNHLGLADKVKVGIPGGMGDIITAMWAADSVLTV
jgi:sulfur relay (sulfurtransferase) complex TusBCD TusD component (DsrE family)